MDAKNHGDVNATTACHFTVLGCSAKPAVDWRLRCGRQDFVICGILSQTVDIRLLLATFVVAFRQHMAT